MESAAPTPTTESGARRRRYLNAAILPAILALLLIAGQWYDSQRRLKTLRQQTDVMRTQLAAIEDRLHETQSRQTALESLTQELSRSSDESVLADIEQTLLIADQELQITGNVKAALSSLQAADARLVHSNHPEFAPVRKALAHDIERLQHAPAPDTVNVSARLDGMLNSIDALPLAMEARSPAKSSPEPAPTAGNTWQQLARTVWQEVRSLIRIQNTGQTDTALLAPEQVFFLRENLKLRLLDARLALLAHDETVFEADLKAAQTALARYFAADDPAVVAARATVRWLAASRAAITPPDLVTSLAALRDYRLAHGQPQ